MDYKKRTKCASCHNTSLNTILKLGEVPLAGFFPLKEELNQQVTFELDLQYCDNCKLVQTNSVISPDVLFKDYRYRSSIGLSEHFISYANWLDRQFGIEGKDILEIGANDGVLLEPLSQRGACAIGIDPATNIVKVAQEKGLNVINDYFSVDSVKKYNLENRFDFLISNNAFAHIIDIRDIVKGVALALKEDGKFIIEIHYLKNLIEEKQWDNIYHEHIYYYSLMALKNLFAPFGLGIVDYKEIPIHSGSIRVVAQKGVNSEHLPDKVQQKLLSEIKLGLGAIEFFKAYQKDVSKHIADFKESLDLYISQGFKIAGYGASGRANMFCNLVGLDSNKVSFIVDESPERCGRYIANTDIPIVDKGHLLSNDVDIVVIFAWNYSQMIMSKLKEKDYTYMIAFPFVQVVKSYEELKGFVSI